MTDVSDTPYGVQRLHSTTTSYVNWLFPCTVWNLNSHVLDMQAHTRHSSLIPTIHTEHCASAADAAFERCAGRAMQSLSLPRPTLLPSSPFAAGRHQEPGQGLVKFQPHFSPGRPEQQHSYPSPPMSDSHSPARRPAHVVESEGQHPYPPPLHEPRPHPPQTPSLLDPRSPHPPQNPSLLDPRSATLPHAVAHQRPLYLGESPSRGPPMHYQPGRPLESPSASVPVPQNYVYGYPQPGVPTYLWNQGLGPGPQVQQGAIIAPQQSRQAKPARRTKAHVASACVNCKKAHLSCDVQRPCGRCVASGKQVSKHRAFA